MNSTKSLTFDLTKILLPKHLVLTYSLIAKVMHYQILFYKNEIELLVFKLYPVSIGYSFSKMISGCSSEWKMNHLKKPRMRDSFMCFYGLKFEVGEIV